MIRAQLLRLWPACLLLTTGTSILMAGPPASSTPAPSTDARLTDAPSTDTRSTDVRLTPAPHASPRQTNRPAAASEDAARDLHSQSPRLVFDDLPDSEQAPHRQGNIYAPEIVRWRDGWLMYYGGQGRDGHDRIHLATSDDGIDWQRQGVVFAPSGVNHVNDASVVQVDGRLWMYYTRASLGVTDTIGLAVSEDGRRWEDRGTVFAPTEDGQWDSLLVGRPSVLYEQGRFRMWYDGRRDLPPGSPDPTAPQSPHSRRYVGYAESDDGVVWRRRPDYVYSRNAGGVHVSRQSGQLIMLVESRQGTMWAASGDGVQWQSRGILLPPAPSAAFGHVTPFLFAREGDLRVVFGAARSERWDRNVLMSAPITLPK